jgi:radical SAM-linked protein
MDKETLNRFRIIYSKKPLLRFIGHLDLLRTWERTLRRAQVPMAYTQGFHPHQRINLGVALPLGFSSECELIDLWLEGEVELNDLIREIGLATPPGIRLHSIEQIELGSPTLQQIIQRAEYQVRLGSEKPLGAVETMVDDLLDLGEIRRERRGKVYDLRPLIESIDVIEGDGSVLLRMRLSAGQEGTGRPDEVLRALGFEPEKAQIVRTRLILTEE